MEHLDDFGALREKFQDAADFVTIYISEAHPTEQVSNIVIFPGGEKTTSSPYFQLIWNIWALQKVQKGY